MKINRMDNVFKVYNKNASVKKAGKTNNKEDKLNISQQAKDYQFAINKLNDIPEIRTEKVDELRTQIKAGTYSIDGNKIAEKMLDSVNFNKKI